MERISVEALDVWVREAGRMALEAQREMTFEERRFKDDGSVVTKTDRDVESFLCTKIENAFPEANIVTEETELPFHSGRRLTFVIDPIDGTDVFSQGMPGWSVSVGVLDAACKPVAGVVHSPALDLMISAMPGERARFNGSILAERTPTGPIAGISNIAVGSRVHHGLPLVRFPGKLRSVGSAALHLCFPLIYAGIVAAVESAGVRTWDIAGAHAINRSVGWELEYLGGGEVDHALLTDGSTVHDYILAGHSKHRAELRRLFLE